MHFEPGTHYWVFFLPCDWVEPRAWYLIHGAFRWNVTLAGDIMTSTGDATSHELREIIKGHSVGRAKDNDRTERRGRPSASAMTTDAARPRSL